jgi:hypothetical protein
MRDCAEFAGVVHLVGRLAVKVQIAAGGGLNIRHGEILHAGFFHALDGFFHRHLRHALVLFPVTGDERSLHVAGDGFHAVLLNQGQQGDEIAAAGAFNFFVANLDDVVGLLHQSAAHGVKLNAKSAVLLGPKQRGGRQREG